ncbi:MAG TPA: ABC transporter ATP-binding protein [Vicinamibacteria bacterium]|nr:ABC transporter ATP-binding protein [Vicinamibacteria bacterium]HRB12097.1 ABC transporter ATP-binding protein [Vicinamibacteria bacterium]
MGSVSVRNVSKDYVLGRTIVRALHDVSLEVERSEFISIAGPSGSGKSTLLNLVSAIDSPTTGEVFIDGIALKSLDDNGLSDLRANKIGFIFQTFNLIPVLSAYENVEFPLLFKRQGRVSKTRVKEVLARVGLQDFMHHRPDELSGGQRQRVAVARALVTDPLIVLADEPTANLDHETGQAVIDLMLEINRSAGTTFIFSTHDPSVMSHARRVIRLVDGRIVTS